MVIGDRLELIIPAQLVKFPLAAWILICKAIDAASVRTCSSLITCANADQTSAQSNQGVVPANDTYDFVVHSIAICYAAVGGWEWAEGHTM
jgi:hypothetical protein